MNCPLCNERMEALVELTGGCNGHSNDDYCYCDSPDVHVEFVCVNRAAWTYDRSRQSKDKLVKNPKHCKQKPIKVGELSCQNSISRWLTEHYEPKSS